MICPTRAFMGQCSHLEVLALFEYRISLVFISGMEFYPLGNLNDQNFTPNYRDWKGSLVWTVGRSVALMIDLMPIKNEPPSPGVCASFPPSGIRMFITVRLKMSGYVSIIFGSLHVDHCGVGQVACYSCSNLGWVEIQSNQHQEKRVIGWCTPGC